MPYTEVRDVIENWGSISGLREHRVYVSVNPRGSYSPSLKLWVTHLLLKLVHAFGQPIILTKIYFQQKLTAYQNRGTWPELSLIATSSSSHSPFIKTVNFVYWDFWSANNPRPKFIVFNHFCNFQEETYCLPKKLRVTHLFIEAFWSTEPLTKILGLSKN